MNLFLIFDSYFSLRDSLKAITLNQKLFPLTSKVLLVQQFV